MAGIRLKEFRKLKNISQAQLAEEINLSNGAIGNYAQGTREPDISTLIILADFFQVSIDELVGHIPMNSKSLISDDELSLIADYRMLGQADKERLQKIISALKNVAAAEQLSETDCV